jgi:mannitol-specific phosphotransferase system IIBC component
MQKFVKAILALLTGGVVAGTDPGSIVVVDPQIAEYINMILGGAVSLFWLWVTSWKDKQE